MLFITLLTLFFHWTGAEEVTRSRTSSEPVPTPSFSEEINQMTIPELSQSVRMLVQGKETCYLQLHLFNVGRKAIDEDQSPIHRAHRIGQTGWKWGIDKPRTYNHLELVLKCQQPQNGTSGIRPAQTMLGASKPLTFANLNQHSQFSSIEAEQAYFARILSENREALSRHGLEWVNSENSNCGFPPRQDRHSDPLGEFPPCEFKPRQ